MRDPFSKWRRRSLLQLSNSRTEQVLECRDALTSDLDGSALRPPTNPVPFKGKSGDRCTNPTRQMWSSLTPVEAGPAEGPAAAGRREKVDAETSQKFHSFRRHVARVDVEDRITTLHHGIGDGDAEFAG